MDDASLVISLAAPFLKYIMPTVFIVSMLVVAEYMFSFVSNLIDWLRKNKARL